MRLFSYVALPTVDFERAFRFYSAVTAGRLRRNPHVPFPMAYFFNDDGTDVGHLFLLPGFSPAKDGELVYMEPADDLTETPNTIVAAGGTVTMSKTALGPGKGFWARFLDTEGNQLALHSSARSGDGA